LLNGSLGIDIKPKNGWLKSNTRKIADDAENTHTSKLHAAIRNA